MIKNIVHEYEKRESQESLLAKDADYLELCLFLKEQADIGNPNGQKWLELYMTRMRTEV
jgi:putative hydrolases of HD superfamily